jgi:AcrR family transcriptional regulator
VATAHPIAPPRRRKGARTADRILDVAERLFAERGFEGTTLRDVAARAGLRNPSLYNHFQSKEALYAAVLERGLGPVLEALTEFVEAGTAPEPDRIVRRVMQLLARRPELPRLILHETLSGGRRLPLALEGWITSAFERARRMAEATSRARRLPADDVPHLVLAVYHALVGYFAFAPLSAQLFEQDLLAPEALERQTRFLEALVRGLLEPPEETPS